MPTKRLVIKYKNKIELKQKNRFIFEHNMYTIISHTKYDEKKTVDRRFSDFEWLLQELQNKYKGYIIPCLPEKNPISNIDMNAIYGNKFKNEFMEDRKQMLSIFIYKILIHPVLKYTKEFKSFLFDD